MSRKLTAPGLLMLATMVSLGDAPAQAQQTACEIDIYNRCVTAAGGDPQMTQGCYEASRSVCDQQQPSGQQQGFQEQQPGQQQPGQQQGFEAQPNQPTDPNIAQGQTPQQPDAGATGTMTASEQQLFDLINNYRAQSGLPAVPYSRKLTLVAQTHARDSVNFPPANGNMHSWSNNGNWTGGAFDNANNASWPIMWNKPNEIAGYPSNGFEISAGQGGSTITPAQALQLWQTSSGHNTVILNQGTWQGFRWQAMGVGIYRGIAHVWFGTDPDQ